MYYIYIRYIYKTYIHIYIYIYISNILANVIFSLFKSVTDLHNKKKKKSVTVQKFAMRNIHNK